MKTLFKINFIFLSSLILTASDSLAQSETWQKKTDMPTRLRWLSACSRDGKIYAMGDLKITIPRH